MDRGQSQFVGMNPHLSMESLFVTSCNESREVRPPLPKTWPNSMLLSGTLIMIIRLFRILSTSTGSLLTLPEGGQLARITVSQHRKLVRYLDHFFITFVIYLNIILNIFGGSLSLVPCYFYVKISLIQ